MRVYDLIIIGAGPAGLTAGLYAGRFRLQSLILEKMSAGGQIILSSSIENFPGFPGGIATQELVDKFQQQVIEAGVKITQEEVLEISRGAQSDPLFYNLKTSANTYAAKTVIFACGAQPKKLGIGGEDKLVGRGVSYCATCDGPLFKDKEVIVIGGGDRAIEEAIFLASYARKVTLIHRRNELRASGILEEKARSIASINLILESVVEEISGLNRVESVKIKNTKSGSLSTLSCQGVFIFVGIQPNTGFLKNFLETDESGFIITDEEMRTSQPGVFACGDCRKKSLYQVVTACAEAAVAASGAHKYLSRQ
ncbi:MAG: thioredoxin-disulfide reductase [Candidatus Omnitrophota bacterium]|jgi:thioredoxin reductase (NADPH)